jgi:hypothetical protein
MTVIVPFPVHRIVRSKKKDQGINPLALLFMPVRLWLGYWTWWIDLAVNSVEPDDGDRMETSIHVPGTTRR